MYPIPEDVLKSWPLPNYVNPATKNAQVVWVFSGLFLFLTTLCVGTRLWARIFVRKWLGLDDVFILLAYVRTR
jgi:hypothetical protein